MPAKQKDDVSIQVGDSGRGVFVPELNISRWDKEATFKIAPRLDGVVESEQTLSLEGDVISRLAHLSLCDENVAIRDPSSCVCHIRSLE